jgi:hypothetical protein
MGTVEHTNVKGSKGQDTWPVVDHRPPLFITMSEAIRRAGNSDHYSGSRNASTLKAWVYGIAKRASGDANGPVMHDGKLYVPVQLHPAL